MLTKEPEVVLLLILLFVLEDRDSTSDVRFPSKGASAEYASVELLRSSVGCVGSCLK